MLDPMPPGGMRGGCRKSRTVSVSLACDEGVGEGRERVLNFLRAFRPERARILSEITRHL